MAPRDRCHLAREGPWLVSAGIQLRPWPRSAIADGRGCIMPVLIGLRKRRCEN